ncbi:NAD(P)-binding domain-containing protein [soil metagenome]
MLPTISIIGASGVMGSGLKTRLIDAGFNVYGFDLDAAIDLEHVCSSDVIILAVPYEAEQAIAHELGSSVHQRIVISMSNPLTRTLDDVVTPHDTSSAEMLVQHMPDARIVKALNTIGAAALFEPHARFDTFVASDDREAARVVENIISAIGFRAWYVGGLILSRTLERMTALMIGITMRYELDGAVGWKIEHKTTKAEQ